MISFDKVKDESLLYSDIRAGWEHYRSRLRAEQEIQRQRTIPQAQEQLLKKREERKELKQKLFGVKYDREQRTYMYRLQCNESATKKVLSRLKYLGMVEKKEGEHYQEQRKKFTAHLQPETVAYLQALKSDGSISNISAFLDELMLIIKKQNS